MPNDAPLSDQQPQPLPPARGCAVVLICAAFGVSVGLALPFIYFDLFAGNRQMGLVANLPDLLRALACLLPLGGTIGALGALAYLRSQRNRKG
jgi:hypothetical protein